MWAAIGRQLRCPSGLPGILVADAMDLLNRRSNLLAIDALRPAAHDTILDLGCGSGRAVQTLVNLCPAARILGIDHSAMMIDRAVRRNRRSIREGRVQFLCGDFAALPYRDDSIDKILAVHTVYFADSAVIGEVRRVLRPGGRIVFVASEKAAMERWAFASQETHRLFDEPALAALLYLAGFKEDEVSCRPVRQIAGVRGILAIATKTMTGKPVQGHSAALSRHQSHKIAS
jgi:ubiquinone/menaquinone biosynthesis C-methylase UbiE